MKLYQHPTEKAFLYTQQGSKKIYMGYYSPDGKRRLKSTKTDDLEEAKIKLQEQLFLNKAEKSGQITVRHDKTETVFYIADKIIKELEITKTPKTTYTQIIRKLKEIQDVYNDLDIKRLNRKELKKVFDIPRSKPQLSYLKTAINKIFEYAEDEEIINGKPSLPKPKILKFKKGRFPISDDQFQKLISFLIDKNENEKNIIKKENKDLLVLMMILLYQTGARLGEIRGLKIKDLKLFNNEEVSSIYLTDSKTDERRIIINDYTRVILQQELLIKIQRKLYNKDSYLFERPSDKVIPKFTEMLKMIKNNNKKFFIDNKLEDFVLYNLRHTFITQRLEANFKIFHIAQYCGTSVQMIHEHYSDYIVNRNSNNIFSDEELSIGKN